MQVAFVCFRDVLSIRPDCGININSGNTVNLTNLTECQIEIQEKMIWGTCNLANWQKIFTFYSFQHVCISGGTLQTTLKGLTYNGVIRRSTESPWNQGFSYRVYCPTSVLLVGQPLGIWQEYCQFQRAVEQKLHPKRIKQWISPI